ncbi:MAG: GNAT family N-acetyltransferase [Bacillota bacterium]|jgi:acetoin utilization protein AcuA
MGQGPDIKKMKKTCYQKELIIPEGLIVIEGPVTAQSLTQLKMDSGLKGFRPPELQWEALQEIAALPEGRVIIAVSQEIIVGYVTFHYPDEFGRWGRSHIPCLLELGAIEVAPRVRGRGVAPQLLQVAFQDEEMEEFIVISTEYYWEWDLEGTGLSVWQYKNMMEKLLGIVNLRPVGTDDPEISAHPANCLMTRFGKKVDYESLRKFEVLRYKNKYTL